MARDAAESGVDLVVSYGGDGTLMEVANGVMGTGVPIAVLPGGTGNAVAIDLKIPLDLRAAADLIVESKARRKFDIGRIGDKYFVLRVYVGIREETVATREE
jgi:diacylglycerol kinase family enzyme